MSLLSSLFDTLKGHVDHVPEADLPMVVAAYNREAAVSTPPGQPIDAAGWRRFEEQQVNYVTHRLVRQVTPHGAPPLVAAAVAAAVGKEPEK